MTPSSQRVDAQPLEVGRFSFERRRPRTPPGPGWIRRSLVEQRLPARLQERRRLLHQLIGSPSGVNELGLTEGGAHIDRGATSGNNDSCLGDASPPAPNGAAAGRAKSGRVEDTEP